MLRQGRVAPVTPYAMPVNNVMIPSQKQSQVPGSAQA